MLEWNQFPEPAEQLLVGFEVAELIVCSFQMLSVLKQNAALNGHPLNFYPRIAVLKTWLAPGLAIWLANVSSPFRGDVVGAL